MNKSDTAEEVAGAPAFDAGAAGADREVADAGGAGAATFSWELPQMYKKDELPALDYERLRADLECYFNDAFFGGCGNSIVFTSGIVLADEATLLQYAKEACFKLDKYKLQAKTQGSF